MTPNDPRIGRITPVELRELWLREDTQFTPWLLENIDYLSDALDLDLEIERAEHPVGSFSLDLIGTVASTGERVIIENQLESTDHNHLGQILTYAGGTEPGYIIWVAKKFREEHRAALDWLNEHTDETTRFFGVEVSAVRIGDSAAAPLFSVVVQPNDWEKSVRTATAASQSARGMLYREFWMQLIERVRASHPSWTRASMGVSSNWLGMPTGVKGIGVNSTFSERGLVCELYMNGADADELFEKLKAQQEQFEAAFGGSLVWDSMEGRKARKISALTEGVIENEESWPAYISWLIETQSKLRRALAATI